MPKTVDDIRGFKMALAGLLTACLLIDPAVGAVAWLSCEQAAAKNEAAELVSRGIDEADLVVLSFTLLETRTLLHWEQAREFEYNGRMYDVVETRTLGDTVLFTCWPDGEETRLNGRLRELASREWDEVCDVDGADERPGSPHRTSLGAVVCDWRIPDPGSRRLRRLPRISPASAVLRPPTPPPRPA
jgi:hypothetical protein